MPESCARDGSDCASQHRNTSRFFLRSASSLKLTSGPATEHSPVPLPLTIPQWAGGIQPKRPKLFFPFLAPLALGWTFMALFAGGGWSWGRQVLVIREDFRLWAQGRVWHTVLIVRRILWRRRQGWVGNILRHRLFLRGRRRGGIRRGGIRSRRGIGHLAIFKLKDLSKSIHVCWGCGTGSLRRTYSALEMKIKASTGAGAAMAGTTGFGVTTLFGFVKHSSSLCSAAAFQAPCKPTGSKWSPFWTLQTIAARCLRRSGSRVGCTGTSCRKALFSSASKSDLGLSSAWLLLVATFNTTNAWLSFKVTRPCTGIDILSCMLTGGRVAMLRAESYKLWSEGGDASLWQRFISLKCKSSSDLRSKIED